MRPFFCAASLLPSPPIRTLDGSKRIENLRIGDLVLSRHEDDPDGPIEVKEVEEVFVRESALLNLSAGGQTIKTTGEHPFYVDGKGWTEARKLQVGDRLVTLNNETITVESVSESSEFETVYNVRVADYHTYFVGTEEWAWSVWSHNLSCSDHAKILRQQLLRNGQTAAKYAAHLVPSTGWSNRSQMVRTAVSDSQRILNQVGIGTNHAANGLFTHCTRHLGTHTDAFQIFLNGQLRFVAGNRSAIISELQSIAGLLKSGVLVF